MDYELSNRLTHAPDYIQELQDLVEPELQLLTKKTLWIGRIKMIMLLQ
jgi:hypothetical protein